VIRGTLAALALALVLAAPTNAGQQYNVSFHAFQLPAGGVTSGTWTSPWFSTGFGFSELIASWNASTRGWAYGDGDIQHRLVGTRATQAATSPSTRSAPRTTR
jgi:hypothetical protein